MLSRMIVSQNSTPGSADFHALWMIFSQSFASMNRSASGCLIDSDSISAPRRPSCATSRVEFE